MSVWQYTGKSLTGGEVKGEVSASNREEVRLLLRKKRVLVNKITRKPLDFKLRLSKGAPLKDLARFTRQFSAMNAAGLPLIQCLETLTEQTENDNLKKSIGKISTDIQGGGTLSDSFSKHKKIFSELYCYMLAAGEAGGILDSILNRLAEYLEKAEKLRQKIRSALMYPSFVLFVAIAVVIILLLKVVPTFEEMFATSGNKLPALTQGILNLSDFVQEYFIFIMIGMVLCPLALYRYYHTEKGQMQLDKLSLKIPVLGDLIRKASVARFTRTLGTLMSSGIPIIDALRITSKTAGNKVLEAGILRALDSISAGQTISEPLEETNIFPPMVIQMISIGEKTGKLSEMLDKVSEFYSDEVDTAVEGLTSLIEPVIIVGLGGIIGTILIAMYLPIFDMASSFQ
jgi:type IV pilus assembly protein PilC